MNLIPVQYRVAAKLLARVVAVAAVVLALCLVYSTIWQRGADHVQAKWDKAVADAALAASQRKEAQGQTTVQVVTQYVDRVKVVREKGDTIIKEVPIYVPVDSPALPGGFRVLHDAAALGELPDPARVADADPADAQTVATTVADNYATCHAIREQLIGLQDWVSGMQQP